jgi:hypothetical protein
MENEITTRYHLRRREFLNGNPTSGEFIIGIVQDTREISDEDEQAWRSGTIQLEVCDGWRWVFFDFQMGNCEERANTLRKINLLAEVINQVREAIQLEVESRNARPHVSYLSDAAVA